MGVLFIPPSYSHIFFIMQRQESFWMGKINKTYTNEVIEPLTIKVLVQLIEQMSSKSINKGLDLSIFYDIHPDLYKNAKSKRKASFKRKRILMITAAPMNKGLVEVAIKNLNEKYKVRGLNLNPDMVEVWCSKDRYLDIYDLLCCEEYSDVILFTKEKRGDTRRIEELAKDMAKYPFLFPNMIRYQAKNSDARSIENELDDTLYISHRLNKDDRSSIWNTYAEIDKLHGLLKEQITTANRMHELMERVINNYALNFIPKEDGLPYFSDSKILVLGDSQLSMDDIRKTVTEHGMDMDQFEFRLDYGKKDSYNLEKLKGNINYKAILIGPVPHKAFGDMKASSGVQEMINRPDLYPLTIKVVSSNGELKINKNTLGAALEKVRNL